MEHVRRQPSPPGLRKMTQSIWYLLGSHTGTCPFWDVPRQDRCCLSQICQRSLNGVPSGESWESKATFQTAQTPPPPNSTGHRFALIMNSNRNFYIPNSIKMFPKLKSLTWSIAAKLKDFPIAALSDNGLFCFQGGKALALANELYCNVQCPLIVYYILALGT